MLSTDEFKQYFGLIFYIMEKRRAVSINPILKRKLNIMASGKPEMVAETRSKEKN